jgi:hypothetical protein
MTKLNSFANWLVKQWSIIIRNLLTNLLIISILLFVIWLWLKANRYSIKQSAIMKKLTTRNWIFFWISLQLFLIISCILLWSLLQFKVNWLDQKSISEWWTLIDFGRKLLWNLGVLVIIYHLLCMIRPIFNKAF